MKSKKIIKKLLEYADIKINGNRPWDIQIHNDKAFSRILANPSLGLGESYVNEWWDCKELDTFFYKVLRARLDQKLKGNLSLAFAALSRSLINQQTKKKAKNVGKVHYDVGNDLYEKMLDKRMAYTCGYWESAKNLDDAQEAKLDLICRKVGLRPGMKVLDIGCGWGSFLQFAGEKYGIEGVGVTISREQVQLGNEKTKGLPVEIRFQDYRDVRGQFDAIVSVGMFEHVGPKNYHTFIKQVHRNLKDDGLFLLHTIGSHFKIASDGDPWLNKYIFPGGITPSQSQVMKSVEDIFVMEDWHNFGVHYSKTCKEWYNRFVANWGALKHDYDERFYRIWSYYLLSCVGSFKARNSQLWQIVFSKKGVLDGYTSVR